MEIRPVISALIHADGRKDMQLTGSFGDYVNAPVNSNLSVQNVIKYSEKLTLNNERCSGLNDTMTIVTWS